MDSLANNNIFSNVLSGKFYRNNNGKMTLDGTAPVYMCFNAHLKPMLLMAFLPVELRILFRV